MSLHAPSVDAAFAAALRRLDQKQQFVLRSYAGKSQAWSADVLRVVAPYLPDVEGPRRDAEVSRLSIVAAHYAANPRWSGLPLGSALARLGRQKSASAAADRLVRGLMSASTVEALGRGPLLRACKALAHESIGVAWEALLKDLAEWHDPRRPAQARLAVQFWGTNHEKEGDHGE